MEWGADKLPQLSNEMQLILMNKVKSGELSIDDALNEARKDREKLKKQKSTDELQEPQTQYNFSVHKHGRYRWQKRVIQFDFKTKLLCSIEKGIVKRQLSFSIVKSCDDGAGSRFSISFKGHHDYELEATSLEDKYKMMELVNKIIYGNIYSGPEEGSTETAQQPTASKSIREGILLLHRGGLASFRWVRYEVKLHPGQLIMVPVKRRATAEGEMAPTVATVIHLSDGNTTVQKTQSPETFSLSTNKNQYHFRVPPQEGSNISGSVKSQRDAWVHALDKLCSDWKRKSYRENFGMDKLSIRNNSITEEEEGEEDSETEQDPNKIPGSIDVNNHAKVNSDTTPDEIARPMPKPRVISIKPNSPKQPQNPSSIFPPSSPEPILKSAVPTSPITIRSPLIPQSPFSPHSNVILLPESPTSVNPPTRLSILPSSAGDLHPQPLVPVLPPAPSPPPFVPAPPVPPPPPLPVKKRTLQRQNLTKAFHWDVIGSEKVSKSFWAQDGAKRIEIDTSRLHKQFAVKKIEALGISESSNSQNIMLNQKVAHNFGIFLKSFPVSPEELKHRLFIVNEDDGGLSDEHITSLRRYVPTIDDVEMYKSHKGPVTELHIVDQYMMEMCNIPFLSSQLDLLLTLRELPVSVNDLQPLINQKIRMCRQLCESYSFVSVLQYLLVIGNYLNENAGKEKARGFRLSTLTKTVQLRGSDRNFTLLHALVEQLLLHEPSLVSFTEELAEFEATPGASIKGLTAEVDVLKNELQKIIQFRKTAKKRKLGEAYPNFIKDLKVSG